MSRAKSHMGGSARKRGIKTYKLDQLGASPITRKKSMLETTRREIGFKDRDASKKKFSRRQPSGGKLNQDPRIKKKTISKKKKRKIGKKNREKGSWGEGKNPSEVVFLSSG